MKENMTSVILNTNAKVATMSSLELVALINETRAEGKKQIRHDHFMVKLEKHPSIDSPKFLGQYKDASGRMSKCYHLPKREAELMVMSESLDVQAKVYDRMTRLEASAPKSDPLAALPAEQRALVALMLQSAEIKATQEKHSIDIARIEESVAVIEARSQPENKHFTVLGYANRIGQKIDFKLASSFGRKCANLSREQGIHIGDVSDPRFGRVHSYHESILEQVLKAA